MPELETIATRASGPRAHAVLAALLAAACAVAAPRAAAAADEKPPEYGPGATPAEVAVSRAGGYGPHLVDGLGRPLYLFTADRRGTEASPAESRCGVGECFSVWPPLVTAGEPRAGDGVDAARLGTIVREPGVRQVTYAGWPLYFYAPDRGERPTGQDVHGFGGEWYLVRPDGSKVEEEEPAR